MAGLLTMTVALFEISSLLFDAINFDWMLIAGFAIIETIGIGSF